MVNSKELKVTIVLFVIAIVLAVILLAGALVNIFVATRWRVEQAHCQSISEDAHYARGHCFLYGEEVEL